MMGDMGFRGGSRVKGDLGLRVDPGFRGDLGLRVDLGVRGDVWFMGDLVFMGGEGFLEDLGLMRDLGVRENVGFRVWCSGMTFTGKGFRGSGGRFRRGRNGSDSCILHIHTLGHPRRSSSSARPFPPNAFRGGLFPSRGGPARELEPFSSQGGTVLVFCKSRARSAAAPISHASFCRFGGDVSKRDASAPPARWITTLSSQVNLPRAIALRGQIGSRTRAQSREMSAKETSSMRRGRVPSRRAIAAHSSSTPATRIDFQIEQLDFQIERIDFQMEQIDFRNEKIDLTPATSQNAVLGDGV